MSDFFPLAEEAGIEEETDDIPEIHTALYATADGWMIHDDLQMIEWLNQLDLCDEYRTEISDLLAKNIPGSYIRLPEAVLVVLDDSISWTLPTK